MTTIHAVIRSPLFWLFLGGLCYYAALPPLNIAPLALAVPICWGIVIQRPKPVRWYWVYLAAFFFWLASIWWIACPHPLTTLGLLALAAYLSLYWVLFFVSARVAVHHFRIPLLVAMPVCWIGCEYLRCRLLGGFSFCSLEHAFYLYPLLIQLASIGGSLLVGGAIMFLGAALCEIFAFFVSSVVKMREDGILAGFTENIKGGDRVPTAIASICIVLYILLLSFLQISLGKKGETEYSIVTLQGDRQVRLTDTPKDAAETFQQFIDLTHKTISERRQKGESLPDLIIFPETVCPIPILVFEGAVKPTDIYLPDEERYMTEEEATDWERWYRQFVQQIDTPVIFGVSTLVFKDNPEKPLRLNSALLVQPQRGEEPEKLYRYDKMHLVMFGEYVPFANYLPDDFILRTLCPESTPGDKPVMFPIMKAGNGAERSNRIGQGSEEEERKTVMASVNICFESTVAHLIRNQVLTLRKQGHDPRVLINLSNVGWFWFSQQIEQHLATHVFRAVENRMYYVTATNGGYSAIISPAGMIEHIGKRGEAEAVGGIVSVNLQRGHSLTLYQKYGDWYALFFAIITLGLAGYTLLSRYSGKKETGKNRAGE